MTRTVPQVTGVRQPESLDASPVSRSSVQDHSEPGRSDGLDQDAADRSNSLDQRLAEIRQCVADLKWTKESVAAHMGQDDSAYVGKVLNGTRPMSLSFFEALPDDVKALYHDRRSEANGRIVVPPVDFETARRNLVVGLMSIIAALASERRLPEHAAGQLKAALNVAEPKRARL